MIWGGISFYGKTPLFIFKPGQYENQEIYINLLESTLIPWSENIFPDGFYIMYHDNARPHVGHESIKWMEDHIPEIQASPPFSPDLNPIEMVWAIIKNKVEKTKPKNFTELEKKIRIAWDDIEQKTIIDCIEHLKKRIKEVFEMGGKFHK